MLKLEVNNIRSTSAIRKYKNHKMYSRTAWLIFFNASRAEFAIFSVKAAIPAFRNTITKIAIPGRGEEDVWF